MFGIQLYKTYKKAKDFFAKPIVHWSFGKWRNNHLLPIWRRGPILRLGKSPYSLNTNCYEIKNRVQIFTGYSTWTDSTGKEHKSKCYDWAATHKLPGGLKSGDIVWNRDIRKKLKKWHLSWIKPQYQLPIWLSFHIFNHDIGWKTKWGDTRYEWPPQFTIVFFGLSFSWWLEAPKLESDRYYEDGYWEGVIDYGFYKNKPGFDISEFLVKQGWMHWTEYSTNEKNSRDEIYKKYKDNNGHLPIYGSDEANQMHSELNKYPGKRMARMCVREAFIHSDKRNYWEAAFSELKAKHTEYTWIR